MITWDFISGEMKYFNFGVWSISYNCLQDKREMKLIAVNFISGDKIICKQYPKWNHRLLFICFIFISPSYYLKTANSQALFCFWYCQNFFYIFFFHRHQQLTIQQGSRVEKNTEEINYSFATKMTSTYFSSQYM